MNKNKTILPVVCAGILLTGCGEQDDVNARISAALSGKPANDTDLNRNEMTIAECIAILQEDGVTDISTDVEGLLGVCKKRERRAGVPIGGEGTFIPIQNGYKGPSTLTTNPIIIPENNVGVEKVPNVREKNVADASEEESKLWGVFNELKAMFTTQFEYIADPSLQPLEHFMEQAVGDCPIDSQYCGYGNGFIEANKDFYLCNTLVGEVYSYCTDRPYSVYYNTGLDGRTVAIAATVNGEHWFQITELMERLQNEGIPTHDISWHEPSYVKGEYKVPSPKAGEKRGKLVKESGFNGEKYMPREPENEVVANEPVILKVPDLSAKVAVAEHTSEQPQLLAVDSVGLTVECVDGNNTVIACPDTSANDEGMTKFQVEEAPGALQEQVNKKPSYKM